MRAGLELLRRISEACGDGSCDYATTVVHTAEAAEGMDPGFYPKNLLYLAQTASKIGKSAEAKEYLSRCLAAKPATPTGGRESCGAR